MLLTKAQSSFKSAAQQFLSILLIMSIIVKEAIATSILIPTGVVTAALLHFLVLIFFAIGTVINILYAAKHIPADISSALTTSVSLATEVLFHCLGFAVAMVIAVISYTILLMTLCGHAVYTVALRLKRSKRRKRYFRRVLKVVTYVGFVICLTYVVREKSTIAMEMTEEYGKATFALALSYMASGRSPASA